MTTHLLWDSVVAPDFMFVHEHMCGWTQLHLLGATDKYLLRCLLNYISRILLESPQHVIQHMSHQC